MSKYGHHDARGNLEFVADNLVLIEQHLSGANVRCPECMVKHAETIRAYSTEGFALDNSEKCMELLRAGARYGDDLIRIISECVAEEGKCEIRNMQDLIAKINEARHLRRDINVALYGLRGDLVYESEGGVPHEHNHDLLGGERHRHSEQRHSH